MRIQPVVLCGGVGSRLWPLSTASHPKQFLPLIAPESMLSLTAARVGDPSRFVAPIVVGAERYQALMRQSVPNARLILEPFGRNSAAAIAAATLVGGEDLIQLVLPADHDIADTVAFISAIETAYMEAQRGQVITFGIEPDRPATSYGYIESEDFGANVRPVRRFVEKPDSVSAKRMIDQGNHFWNSGIFMFRVDVMLDSFNKHAPDILESVDLALEAVKDDVTILNPEHFANCRSESIDYAVMEKAENISVVPVSMGWSDIGDHAALSKALTLGTPSGSIGPTLAIESEQCFVRSDGPIVGLYGVSDLAVVATRDAVLVTRTDKAANVKELVEGVEARAVNAQIRPDVRQRVGIWLFETLFPQWLERAWDPSGGFVEALDEEGTPLVSLPRRGRVAPRQVFAFSEAVLRGWDPQGAASEIVAKGIAHLDKSARSPAGGWATVTGPNGEIADAKRSLYDHAFVAMAGAHAYRAIGSRQALDVANEAFDLIDSVFRDGSGEGWSDPDGPAFERLANPHMHLLEASLAMFEATFDRRSLDRAEEIATLFEDYMFSSKTGAMFEDFDSDWAVVPDQNQARVEPGHCYEWAYLLKRLDVLSGRDTRSWCNRLVSFADNAGTGSHGRVVNAITQRGTVLNGNSRLWPQLERIRAKLHVVEASAPGAVDGLIVSVFDDYIEPASPGLWLDELCAAGASLRSQVPSSMLYHFATAFAPIALPAS